MKTLVRKKNTLSNLFGQKNKKITICPHCSDVHYKGVWYVPYSRFALEIDDKEDLIFYQSCPACQMQSEGKYEGVLYLKDVPDTIENKVVSLVLAEAEQEYYKNPQHRIVEFSGMLDGHKITANSAEMVQRISEKIQSEFNACEAHSTYQQGPESLQIIHLTFMHLDK